jgi:hypothetical protein
VTNSARLRVYTGIGNKASGYNLREAGMPPPTLQSSLQRGLLSVPIQSSIVRLRDFIAKRHFGPILILAGLTLVAVGCAGRPRNASLKASDLAQHQISVTVELQQVVTAKQLVERQGIPKGSSLYGVFTNGSNETYLSVWLIVSLLDYESVTLRKEWILLHNVSPGDKVRIDYPMEYDPRVRKAELREVRLTR